MAHTVKSKHLIKILIVASFLFFSNVVYADLKEVIAKACVDEYLKKDFNSASQLCTKAAEQDDARAQFYLGEMLEKGYGTLQDFRRPLYWHQKSFLWFERSAKQGYVPAQFKLGYLYEIGRGTNKDHLKAYAWYNISIEQGNKEATESRNSIEKKMTSRQIKNAQKLSKEYYSKYVN